MFIINMVVIMLFRLLMLLFIGGVVWCVIWFVFWVFCWVSRMCGVSRLVIGLGRLMMLMVFLSR